MKAKRYLTTLLLCFFSIYSVSALVNVNFEEANEAQQESALTIIESLQNGESYSIEITSVGCFNGKRQTIVISREVDILTAEYLNFSKILTEQDISAFITFELQLHSLKMGGCSTVDSYVIRYGNETFQTSDGTCNWNGGKKLLRAIS